MPGSRIARVLASAGLFSRRAAEAAVLAGRVSVNGVILRSPACDVTDSDHVCVDGARIPPARPFQLYLVHKLRGEIVARSSRESALPVHRSVFTRVEGMGLPVNLVSVGRLDVDSMGLLLLTTLGPFARFMEHPNSCIPRVYHVHVRGAPRDVAAVVDDFNAGVTVDGVRYRAGQAGLLQPTLLRVQLTEGKNREIRRICEAQRVGVDKLIRVGYGPFTLGDLPPGSALRVTPPRALINAFQRSIEIRRGSGRGEAVEASQLEAAA